MALRYYQQNAHDAAIDYIRKHVEPCVIEAATGSGKSHCIAALAETVHAMSNGKHVLCLAPSAELVEQNREKFLATGNPASVFSASAGQKCLRHPVVFGTPGTVKNSIKRFGSKFALIVVDECHEITPTIQAIIEQIRNVNPKVRVIGLSATPYRLGEGFIYKMDEKGRPMGEHCCRDPYFTQKVYTVPAQLLIDEGYLTPPRVGSINLEGYDTSALLPNSSKSQVEAAFVGHGRKTSAIVGDVVRQSVDRKGVMLFAQTIRHAEEIAASLPPALTRVITGKTGKTDRRNWIKDFKAQKFKYLVSVGTLTKGFDASHVDVIAILRYTDSVALLQQIIGRGLRLHDDKIDCLVLDYTGAIDKHCPDGDLFRPEIRASFRASTGAIIHAACEQCGTVNEFGARPNDAGLEYDEQGYFVDLDGNRVMTDAGPMPGHFGRRCQGLSRIDGGTFLQCSYRWTAKKCPECDADNDIAAKYCCECKAEIIDPNEKLIGDFKQYKRDPTNIQTDKVLNWTLKPTVGRSGKECLRVDYTTEYRTFSIWYFPTAEGGPRRVEYARFSEATNEGKEKPETLTYRKGGTTGFFRVFDYNRPADEIPHP